MDTFDLYSLAGNSMFQDTIRTAMRRVGPQIVMELTRLAASDGVNPGDQQIALKAIDAVSAILHRLGIATGGSYGNVDLSIAELIQALLSSDAVEGVTYASIKAGVIDGSIRPTIDAALYTFLKSMTGLAVMTPEAQASMEVVRR